VLVLVWVPDMRVHVMLQPAAIVTSVGEKKLRLTLTCEQACMVQVSDAAPLRFPAVSTARTSKVWVPAVRPEYDIGLVHAENVPASILHWKVTPDSVSVKLKLAFVEVLGSGGVELIVGVGGAVRSIVNVLETTVDTLFSSSVDLARIV
jgi:hypothetical protein